MAEAPRLDLDSAWKAVLRDLGSDNIPDVIRWADHAFGWKGMRSELETEVASGSYRPAPGRVVEVPKTALMIRPFCWLRPRDRVIYYACVRALAGPIEAVMGPEVFSSRFDLKKQRVRKQVASWTRMQQEARRLHVDEGLSTMLTTDVVSYFEYVDIELLIKELKQLADSDPSVIDLLSRFLNDINRNSAVWGLPQGPEVSGMLGNFYMLPIDRVLHLAPVKALRFQDDIKVFAHDESALKIVLSAAISKTKIFVGAQVLEELEDSRKDGIQYGIEVSGLASVLPDLRALFDDAVGGDEVSVRDVRFSIGRLAKAKDRHAVPWILENLDRVPYLASLLVDYLSGCLREVPDIEPNIVDYIQDPRRNLYPWVELHLVRMFSLAPEISDETLSCVWSVLRDSSKDGLVREQAARCVGRHARAGDHSLLRTEFDNSHDHDLRRALLVAVTESAGAPDKSLLGVVAASSPDLAITAKFLATGAVIPSP